MWWARHLLARNISYFPISWWHTPRCFTAWRRSRSKRPKACGRGVSETRLAEESYAMKQENQNLPGIAEEVLAVLRCLFSKATRHRVVVDLYWEDCVDTFRLLGALGGLI